MTDPSDPTPCLLCKKRRGLHEALTLACPYQDGFSRHRSFKPDPPEPEKKAVKQELPVEWFRYSGAGVSWRVTRDDLLALIPRLDPEQQSVLHDALNPSARIHRERIAQERDVARAERSNARSRVEELETERVRLLGERDAAIKRAEEAQCRAIAAIRTADDFRYQAEYAADEQKFAIVAALDRADCGDPWMRIVQNAPRVDPSHETPLVTAPAPEKTPPADHLPANCSVAPGVEKTGLLCPHGLENRHYCSNCFPHPRMVPATELEEARRYLTDGKWAPLTAEAMMQLTDASWEAGKFSMRLLAAECWRLHREIATLKNHETCSKCGESPYLSAERKKPPEPPKCGTCGGKGSIWPRGPAWPQVCPDCSGGEPPKCPRCNGEGGFSVDYPPGGWQICQDCRGTKSAK